ncbi:MAG: alpha/beta hydrolase [Verrucomicrobiales bacterium]|nr:alpha/beta hydrolase [Verrucomicrobiales bacterium]
MLIKRQLLPVALFLAVAVGSGCTQSDKGSIGRSCAQGEKTYVIVHGAWGGGWGFKELDAILTAAGHKVYRPTLTGQGERVHLASTNIDLETHITDVVNLIIWEELRDVVLVGHSYGGMVITGVADRVPDRIAHLVYLDAFVPEHGESVGAIRGTIGGQPVVTNGFVIPHWVKDGDPIPHDVPHPAQTLLQPITLTNQAAARAIRTTYILTVDEGAKPEQDGFYPFYMRAVERGWKTQVMVADHNPQRSKPRELAELLLKLQ